MPSAPFDRPSKATSDGIWVSKGLPAGVEEFTLRTTFNDGNGKIVRQTRLGIVDENGKAQLVGKTLAKATYVGVAVAPAATVEHQISGHGERDGHHLSIAINVVRTHPKTSLLSAIGRGHHSH